MPKRRLLFAAFVYYTIPLIHCAVYGVNPGATACHEFGIEVIRTERAVGQGWRPSHSHVPHQARPGGEVWTGQGQEHVLRRGFPADVVLPAVHCSNTNVHGLLLVGEHGGVEVVSVRTVPTSAGARLA
jgi:hypothetical protein